MARNLVLNLIGDPQSLLRSFKQSAVAADTLGRDLKALGLTAEQSASKQVQASVRRDARLRQEIVAYRKIAAAAAQGSREQVTAANLAANAERRLASSLGVTAQEAKIHAASVATADRQLGKAARGALAGAGIFHSLGRSLAFASGGFLAIATASNLIRQSIDAATEAAQSQRQLGAQFRANGLNLTTYNDQIESTILATSKLAGVEDDELRKSFTAAFRGSKSVDAGLKIMKASTDAAAGSHKNLQVVTLALTKAYLGQTGAARRLGILIPPQLHGLEAIAFVQRRFAKQAEEGATSQERFNAAMHRTKETVGFELLPAVTRILDRTTNWLDQQKNQKKIADEVNRTLKDGAEIVKGLNAGFQVTAPIIRDVTRSVGGLGNAVEILFGIWTVRKLAAVSESFRNIGVAVLGTTKNIEAMNAAAGAGLGKSKVPPVIGPLTREQAARQEATQIGSAAAGGAAAGGATSLLSKIKGLKPGALIGPALIGIVAGEISNSLGRPPTPADVGFKIKPAANEFAKNLTKVVGDVIQAALTASAKSGINVTPLGFKAKFADAELKLAQAQLTTQQSDDRRVLVVEARLIAERIKTISGHRKHLQEQISLTQQLKSVQDQITSIDQQGLQNTIRFKNLELQLAQAQLTATQTDDRKILEAEAQAVRGRLATLPKTKATLDARISLTQQLVGIEGQISSIDQQAKQAQLDALDKQKQNAENQLQKIRTKEQNLRQKIKAITDQLAQTVSTVRDQIGALFSGPVLAPTEQQIKAALGVKFESLDPKALTKDLNAQVRAFASFEHGLAQLAKRGAPKELLKELQAQGLAAAPEVAALAGASASDLKAFFKAFSRRERLAINSARTEMKAQLVTLHADRVTLRGLRQQEVKVEIEVKGIDKRAVKVRTRKTTIAGGRSAGR